MLHSAWSTLCFPARCSVQVCSTCWGKADLSPRSSQSPPRSCLCRSQERSPGRARGEQGSQDGRERGAGAKHTLVCFPPLAAEKRLTGCKVSTLPGRSLFLPFRVPPAFLLQCLGSCDCSTPLTPRLLWKPMNCLRKVSWQPPQPRSCLPSPAGLGQCRSPLCRQRPSVTSSPCFLTCFFQQHPLLATPKQAPCHGESGTGAPCRLGPCSVPR